MDQNERILNATFTTISLANGIREEELSLEVIGFFFNPEYLFFRITGESDRAPRI